MLATGLFFRVFKEVVPVMDFGQALKHLKDADAVHRDGWNGKKMFIYLVPENRYKAQTEVAKSYFGDDVPYRAYIAMKTVSNDVVPWVASQTDLLSDDWHLYGE